MKANKLKDLTWLFFINIFISSFTFGGGYVVVSMVRKYFVEKRKIFNESDLITMTAISQTTPGAIAINLAALAGYKVAGTIGTIVSCIGAIIPPITILAVVSLWYQVFSTNHIIMDILIGMTRAINEQHSKLLTAMIPITFIASYIFKVNIVVIILITIIVATAQLYYRRRYCQC